jgi:hypothetical protein
MHMRVFWDVALCTVLDISRRFGGTCCLHLQSRRVRGDVPLPRPTFLHHSFTVYPDDRDSTLRRNVGKYIPNCTAVHYSIQCQQLYNSDVTTAFIIFTVQNGMQQLTFIIIIIINIITLNSYGLHYHCYLQPISNTARASTAPPSPFPACGAVGLGRWGGGTLFVAGHPPSPAPTVGAPVVLPLGPRFDAMFQNVTEFQPLART